jgi:hypothetical protein
MSEAGAWPERFRKVGMLCPLVVLVLALFPAIWHKLDFDDDLDPEFPAVIRPTFSHVAPAAYRLAEPGDTLDRVALYLAATGVVVAVTGSALHRGGALWPAGIALAVAALWHSATPGPTFDGWHGLGWRTMADPRADWALRALLAIAAWLLGGVVALNVLRARGLLRAYFHDASSRRDAALWVASFVLVVARQFEIPGVEPQGYWPRWALICGLLGFDLGLLIAALPELRKWRRRVVAVPLWATAWAALVYGGIWLTWYHRPLGRFRVVEPGRIYMSAMPTPLGLRVEFARLHFRTIINLFPEETRQRSPLLPDELRFARAHGIRYVGSPSNPSQTASSRFLDETLELAQDPAAWPILVHCHGCMDRTPAWMGIYRFVVQKRPLLEIMQEIERHRGYRPWSAVVLLYNRVLPSRAGARYWADPTAARLRGGADRAEPRTGRRRHGGSEPGRPTACRLGRAIGEAPDSLTPGASPVDHRRSAYGPSSEPTRPMASNRA